MVPARRKTAPKLRFARAAAAIVGAAWLSLSLTHGGLRSSLAGLRAPRRGPAQPDARRQWSGPYFDALDELAARMGGRGTLGVALTSADEPGWNAPPTRMYETIYRLYPVRPDFFLPAAKGEYAPFWFKCPRNQIPQAPGLWEHDYVLWAAGGRASPPEGWRPVFSNSAAAIYQGPPR